jgi:hypothetical protein
MHVPSIHGTQRRSGADTGSSQIQRGYYSQCCRLHCARGTENTELDLRGYWESGMKITLTATLVRPGVIHVHLNGRIANVYVVFCQECSHGGQILEYMIRNEIWNALGLEGIICLFCLRRRLGRPLCISDFDMRLPINNESITPMELARIEYYHNALYSVHS